MNKYIYVPYTTLHSTRMWTSRRTRKFLKARKKYRRKFIKFLRYGTLPAATGWNNRALTIGAEAKYNDCYIGAASNPNNGYATPATLHPSYVLFCPLNGIAQGVGVNNRIGNRIKMLYVDIRLEIRVRSTEIAVDCTPGCVGYILLLDMQANGVQPGIGDVLQAMNPGANEYMAYNMLNLNNRARFRVLARGYKAIGGTTATNGTMFSGGPWAVVFKKHKRINRQTTYQGIDNSVASISTNALYLILLGPSNTGTALGGSEWDNSYPLVNGVVRLRFRDA
jgi:hypothetical protein